MTQLVQYLQGDDVVCRELPNASEHVLPGVTWGESWRTFTPAYWVAQMWMSEIDQKPVSPFSATGTLAEEVAFCLLGGFGITAELAGAAFDACSAAGLVSGLCTDATAWTSVLRQPLDQAGRTVRYRYPNQKAVYLAAAMGAISQGLVDTSSGKALRDSLLAIQGIGPKTAGWVARNVLDTDEVAILDIHIVRAGLLCNLYSFEQKVERDYFAMEAQFLALCRGLGVRPAMLDCIIWTEMRELGPVVHQALDRRRGAPAPPVDRTAPTLAHCVAW
ncbi:hypothetical protein GCM10007320_34940 [Pseudorhodoferax aquiterrae]|uniref:8-oxoguanine DNA glycosylase n=1 Tax=Pseudorhodoferax aquiterrae TaxID=747304 RepID=A0ABQ3G539_9BURK|nr:8-oxoguanine DNA glycosylase [Pseudorhodoferax aquiterrae]GHC88090.1 hypothetical protein GCM10007320_34940 [Pseudorhodoferax aquiterrae]